MSCSSFTLHMLKNVCCANGKWSVSSSTCNKLCVLLRRHMAGHSKWANIKHKKMHKDFARSKTFQKLSMEISQAARETGADVNQNSRLQSLIARAKAADMPKDKIEQAIKNALRDTDEKRSSLILQARGPGQCGLIIDALAANALRCRHEVKAILRKNDLPHLFSRPDREAAVYQINRS